MSPSVLLVALPRPLPEPFAYAPPAGFAVDANWVGCRVRVPLGKGEVIGVVVGVEPSSSDPARLKPITARLDTEPLLEAALWDALQFAARYYHQPFGEVWTTALPTSLREGDALPDTTVWQWTLTEAGHTALPRLRPGRPRQLAIQLADRAQREDRLDIALPGWRDAARRLLERGLARREAADAGATRDVGESPLILNAEQQAAVTELRTAAGFQSFLLDGVTGSGKTEVYLAAIRDCLAQGRQALLLVPEIGLTSPILHRLQRGLGQPVLALHSGLSDGERARAWAALRRGEARVAVGTRSAVFAPLPEGGLIIVDEEHDASYKQQDGVRYHARDLALWRGQRLGVPVLLGSATPALESLQRALAGQTTRLRLRARAVPGAAAPAVRVIDLRKRRANGGLTTEALAALQACLERGEQALVFRNRRGYAPTLLCHDCGWHAACPRCDAATTVHAGGRRLVCHHCGQRPARPLACPDCGSLGLQPQGSGTERLEEQLATHFPSAAVLRIDRDTTAVRDGLAKQLNKLGTNPGIVVGTQMLAKGHDLPLLTTVVVSSIDEGLYSADFRAGERLAQLLVQVSGRAGRHQRPGEVLLQTHHPEHPWLVQLLAGGYAALAASLLAEREATRLPPFQSLALVRAEAPHAEPAQAFLHAVAATLSDQPGLGVGPVLPAPMPRRAGRQRFQLLLDAHPRRALQAALSRAAPLWYALPEARRVRWSLDVDPIDLY